MRSIHPQRVGGRRGTNAVEFAIILPFFLLFVAGTMEFAWIFWQRTSMVDIVRYGCRAGSVVSPVDGDPESVAVASMEEWGGIIHKGMACDGVSGGYCTVDAEVEITPSGLAELHCGATIHEYAPLLGVINIPRPKDGVRVESIIRLELQP